MEGEVEQVEEELVELAELHARFACMLLKDRVKREKCLEIVTKMSLGKLTEDDVKEARRVLTEEELKRIMMIAMRMALKP